MRKLPTLTALVVGVGVAAAPLFAQDSRIVKEPLELTIHMHAKQYPGYQEDWPVEIKARELTGIHMIDQTTGKNDESSKKALNLMLATGEIPNIVAGSNVKDFVFQYGPEGAFLPLEDLIDEHAPHLKAFFDERPQLKSAATSADGHLYYIPYFPDGKYGRAYFMRTDWLDTLGLESPTTVDELHTVLNRVPRWRPQWQW